MKKSVFKFIILMISFILGVLGFSSCITAEEYGAPMADFDQIVDVDTTPDVDSTTDVDRTPQPDYDIQPEYGVPPADFDKLQDRDQIPVPDEDEPIADAEYGCPHVYYEIDGTVKDETGEPIEGIEVTDLYNGEITKTDDKGKWTIVKEELCGDIVTETQIEAKDIDGEDNGGYFNTAAVDVKMVNMEEGDGEWDQGKWAAHDVEITMEQMPAAEYGPPPTLFNKNLKK